MPASIKVTVVPGQLKIVPGEQATAVISIRNRSEEVGHYRLITEKLPDSYATINPDQVSAFPEQETRSEITVHPPLDAPEVTYPALISVSLQGKTEAEERVPLEVVILASPHQVVQQQEMKQTDTRTVKEPVQTVTPVIADQIRVLAEKQSSPDLPATAVRWRLTLSNAGNVLDSFVFGFTGVSPNWVSIDPAEVTLRPNEEEKGTASITVNPPIDTAAKTYTCNLQVFSVLNINQRTVVPLSFEILPRAGYTLSVNPPEAEAQGLREFAVSLESAADSNTNLTISLSGADEENACDFTFEPSQITLLARQKASSVLRVRPKINLGPNERRTYKFKVTALPQSRPDLAKISEARLNQVGIPPVSIGLKPQVQTGELEGRYTLVITNPSTVDLTLHLAGSDAEAVCDYRFAQAQTTVPARSEVQVGLTVVTRNYSEVEKTITFVATATREGELIPMTKAEGRFIQKPVRLVTLSLNPTQQSSKTKARYFVKMSNPRARAVQVVLGAQDEADALSFSFNPPQVQLSAGAEGGSWLTVRPKDKLMTG
ncbi:MAG: COG1470 family protein, partial [Anaerolineae bacterium]